MSIVSVLEKALALLESERQLLIMCIEHPHINSTPSQHSKPSSLYWQGNQSDLIELISALDYAGYISDISQKPIPFSKLVKEFGHFLNLPVTKPFIVRSDLAKRKKCLSVLLTKLKIVFEKKHSELRHLIICVL